MRNNILVRNTAYYISSLVSRASQINIANMDKQENNAYNNCPSISILANKRHLHKVNAGACSVNVINNSKDEDKYLKFGACSNVMIRHDNSSNCKYATSMTNIANKCNYGIVVLGTSDKSYKVDGKVFYVRNKSIEGEVFDRVFESMESFVESPYTTGETFARSGSLFVNNMQVAKIADNTIQPSVHALVKKMPTCSYEIRVDNSITISSPKHTDGYINGDLISIDVSNAVNNEVGGGGTGSSNGGDLKKLEFTIQQMSFFEFKLNFESKKIKDVGNLPTGLFFDHPGQRIIGTPMLSGTFSILVLFNDDTTLSGTIEVPKLNREL